MSDLPPPEPAPHPLRHAPRSARRAQRFDLPPDLTFTLRPIGVVRSPFLMREDAPRQGSIGIGPQSEGEIILRPGMQNALQDLSGFSHAWVITYFHRSRGWKSQIVPPRDTKKRGVFATRAPDRPNPLGLSCVAIVAIYGCSLRIRGHDLLDGTPVLDLKPYLPAYDALPDAQSGYVAELPETAPDHRVRSDPPSRRPRPMEHRP